jgi:predicted permease
LEPVGNGVSNLRGQFLPGLNMLMGGVALLLLMTCANVAGLLLARSTLRTREISIRRALGASASRIVRQLLTEGLLLALLGGALGIVLSRAALPFLIQGLPTVRDRAAVLQPLAVHIDIDGRVLPFALLLTLSTVLLFALSQALQSARSELARNLGSRSTTARLLTRNLIVITQVSICVVILIGAVLLVQTLERMRAMDPGFDRDRIVTFTIDPGVKGYSAEKGRAFSKSLLERTGQLPGVSAVGVASRGLMRGTGVKATFGPAGAPIQPDDFLNTSLNAVMPGYFDSMGMRILAGRDFNWFDRPQDGTAKAIVNQTFASRFFPGRNPIGERIGMAGAGNVARSGSEIIGVVSDAKYRSIREPIPPTVYVPAVDGFDSVFVLNVRTNQRPETMILPVRNVLRALDAELPFIEVQTLRGEVEASLWQERLLAALSTIFGGIAVLVVSLGLYGALDYAVKSRTREIGVRVAVGAEPMRIIGLLGREVLLLIFCGSVLGLGLYAAAAHWIRRAVYEVPAWDPILIAAVIAVIAAVAATAVAPAIRRAVRIDPAMALRAE